MIVGVLRVERQTGFKGRDGFFRLIDRNTGFAQVVNNLLVPVTGPHRHPVIRDLAFDFPQLTVGIPEHVKGPGVSRLCTKHLLAETDAPVR
ncbi:MAG: hypothetical protein WAK95_14960 [Desulfobacterales bacterium]